MNPWDADPITTGEIAQDTQWRGITPHGHDYRMWVRPGTSDWNTVNACSGLHDEYRIPAGLSGWALDIGAHIGACAIPLLIDNPDLRVQAVEALSENARMLRANADLNGVSERLEVALAAASDTQGEWASIALPDEEQHHWIGNQSHTSSTMRPILTVNLGRLMQRAGHGLGIDRYRWVKMDCEGCEYAFLVDPVMNAYLDHIEGEVHGDHAVLVSMLEPTHIVTTKEDQHFTATRRPLAGVH